MKVPSMGVVYIQKGGARKPANVVKEGSPSKGRLSTAATFPGGPSATHERIPVHPESPRALDGHPDPDAGTACNPGHGRAILSNAQNRTGKRCVVEIEVDAQGLAETRRTLGELGPLFSAPAGLHAIQARLRPQRAHQHRRRLTLGFRHDIEAVMHSIGEINIRSSGWTIENPRAACASRRGVAGGIGFPDVGLCLHDLPHRERSVRFAPAKEAPEQVARDLQRGPGIERNGKETTGRPFEPPAEGWVHSTPQSASARLSSARIASRSASVRPSARSTRTGSVLEARTSPHPCSNSMRAPSTSITGWVARNPSRIRDTSSNFSSSEHVTRISGVAAYLGSSSTAEDSDRWVPAIQRARCAAA